MPNHQTVVLGPEYNQLTFVGTLADRGLSDYAKKVIFEQPHIRDDEHGDSAYRGSTGRYNALIYEGRGSYLVVLAFNLGLSRQRYHGEVFEENPPQHRGHVIIDRALSGYSLASALQAMSAMLVRLTSGGYVNHPDAALIASALPFETIPRPEAA